MPEGGNRSGTCAGMCVGTCAGMCVGTCAGMCSTGYRTQRTMLTSVLHMVTQACALIENPRFGSTIPASSSCGPTQSRKP